MMSFMPLIQTKLRAKEQRNKGKYHKTFRLRLHKPQVILQHFNVFEILTTARCVVNGHLDVSTTRIIEPNVHSYLKQHDHNG